MADEKPKTVTRTIAVAGFPYKQLLPDGSEVWAFAQRNETVELHDPADISRGDNNDHFVKPGEKAPGTPAPLGLDELGLMTDEQLDDLWRNARPTVKEATEATGDDPELARRILDVELNCGHEPRGSLIEKLEAITHDEGTGD